MEIASLSLPLFGNLPLHLWVCIQVSLDNGIKEQSSTLDMGCLCHLEDRVLVVAANHRAPQRLSGLQIGFDHLHGSLLVIGVLTLPEADIKRGTFATCSLLVSHTLVCDECPAPGIDVCNLEQLITTIHEH